MSHLKGKWVHLKVNNELSSQNNSEEAIFLLQVDR